jgi:hypothetical protein
LALGERLNGTVRPGQRPASCPRDLTTQQPLLRDPRTKWTTPDDEGRHIGMPAAPHDRANPIKRSARWPLKRPEFPGGWVVTRPPGWGSRS